MKPSTSGSAAPTQQNGMISSSDEISEYYPHIGEQLFSVFFICLNSADVFSLVSSSSYAKPLPFRQYSRILFYLFIFYINVSGSCW